MKSIRFAFMALFAIAGLAGTAFAQSEETRNVSGYTGISSGGSFTIYVKIDGTETCKLKGDAEDLKKIETVVEHGVLQIRFPKKEEWKHDHIGHVDVYVTAKSLSSIALGGSGSIDVDGVVKGTNVRVSMGGSGNITTAVDAGALDINIAGSGNINMKGRTNDVHISIAGSGNLKASDLKADNADIGIAGSGDVRMEVDKILSAYIAGSGNVVYTGNANIKSISSAGSGRITRMK